MRLCVNEKIPPLTPYICTATKQEKGANKAAFLKVYREGGAPQGVQRRRCPARGGGKVVLRKVHSAPQSV
jgi:hypothetical protein